ncbi:MAG: MFS transporter [Candidatus Eremiobacteraeota bacterium]|nr:MFS transporter [Candidatus Eremiobacteraeota bacterium]
MTAPSASIAGHQVDRSNLPLLFTLGLGVFAGALDLGVLAPAIPALSAAFHIPTGDLAWVYTLYLLVTIVSITITTKLADQYGRRPVYIACVTTFALGSLLAIVSPSYGIFLLARALQAFGAGGIFPVATAAIGDVVPLERRGSALGLIGATWGLAAVIGPNVGGIVTHALSWHWIFAAIIPLALVVIALARRYVPVNAMRARGPLDVQGLSALSVGLAALMLGLATSRYYLLLITAATSIAFYAAERGAKAPIFSPLLFANAQLMKAYGLEVIIGLLEGALFFIPASLIAAQHLSAVAAGAIAGMGAIIFVAVIPLSGRALDTFGSRPVLTAGASLTTIGLIFYALYFDALWPAMIGIGLAGVGFGSLLGAPTRYIVTNEAPNHLRATAIGLLSQCLIIGQIVGGSLAGAIVRHQSNLVSGFRDSYEIFALFGVVGIAVTFTLKAAPAERSSKASGFAG